MQRPFFTIAIGTAILASGPAVAKKEPQLTPMELQALQSKEFEATKEVLFASVVSVFQDLGYQLDNADMASGFITASSESTNKTSLWDALGRQQASGNTKATAFVEQMPNGMARVRLNFLNSKSTSGLYGSSKKDKKVLDPKTYSVAWDKIDEALFVRGSLTEAKKAGEPNPAAMIPAAAPGPGPKVEGQN
jgi:hypothetical protein